MLSGLWRKFIHGLPGSEFQRSQVVLNSSGMHLIFALYIGGVMMTIGIIYSIILLQTALHVMDDLMLMVFNR